MKCAVERKSTSFPIRNELGVLRLYAAPQLKKVPENCPEYAEAQRLLNFLEVIEPIEPTYIPPTSIMREFLGGSSFLY